MSNSTKQPHAKGNLCGAKTRSGAPCKNKAMPNGRCRMHGGKSTGAPKKNKNSEKHGLFSKYLPEDSLEIFNSIEEKSPIDMLWDQIKLQYTTIIRAQTIMHVDSKDELIRTLKRQKESESLTGSGWEKEYELHFAWDRQAQFLSSQSRAMSSLAGMIEKYDKLCQSDLATEEQRLRIEKVKVDIDKTKAEIEKIKDIGTDDDLEFNININYQSPAGDLDGD